MAERREAEDEFNPRHRIVGAVILVALAVVFLPMVLNDQPPPSGAPAPAAGPAPDSGRAPPGDPLGSPPPAAGPATRIVTVPVEPVAVGPDAGVAPAPVRAPEAAPVARVEPSPANPPSAPEAAPVAAAPAAVSGGWVVQVGVFSQAENARRLEQRLKARGYAVRLDPPGAPRGKTVRVEVGPYPDAAAARAAASRIDREFGIKGLVRSH